MTYLAVASFPYFTGLPEDVIVNTWHFTHPAGPPDEAAFQDLREKFTAFYEGVYAVAAGLRFAPWVRPLLNTLRVYDLDDPEPRQPILDSSIPLTLGTAATTSAVPPETAICLSYQAEPQSGIPQARRRGRVFLGGFAIAVDNGTASAFPATSALARTNIATAAEAFLQSGLTDGWIWVVHSRTVAGDSVVTNGWIDDEIDTQRRRGRGPTTRTTWP